MNDAFGWAICRPQTWGGGEPALFTVSATRAEAIEKALKLWGPNTTWKTLYRQGWRARHVRVTPILFGASSAPNLAPQPAGGAA